MIKPLYKSPRWDSLRATLFGKFYESIVANYFAYVLGFTVYDKYIAINIRDLEYLDKNEMMHRIQPVIKQGVVPVDLAKDIIKLFITKLNKLKKLKERKRFNPDLIVEKNNRYYIVEMQAWPVWLKQRYHSTVLSWKVILNEGVAIIPRVLASKVKINGNFYPVAGFYYISYSRGPEHKNIETFFKILSRREFKIMYIDEIVKETKNYDWFGALLKKVRSHVLDLLDGLKCGEIRINITD